MSGDDELDTLANWLNPKGIRELALHRSIAVWRPYISGGARKRLADIENASRAADTRRSSRSKAKWGPYLNYVNKLAATR